ncbi:anthrone oxygenase family protein [Persicitalea jodogahamensis]|uniref:DUF1772 domain-containing protein n=1 Tax=Persicitalea jodogahamensis TaxID=402147 RepID=A0A8J3G9S1_9BACT|nr:anthrone oxygenase family protein [Persicitalea jodogahamensis]GHB75444.1 hypothetical protein GCM10007390_31480 [Persicitalea jodogahamensis]
MVLKTIQFIQVLLLCIIAGQAFFYLIGGTAGVRYVSVHAFIEQRKAIDIAIGPNLKILYPMCALSGIAVLILLRQQIHTLTFCLSAAALLLVLIDMVIAVKGNVPINQQMMGWTATVHPADWATVRDQWLAYMHWRQGCSITALLCLLVSLFSRL